MRKAFTLMEILVSVLLISIVVLGIAKIRERNIAMSHYIADRVKTELSNSLFLKKEFIRYDKGEKDAYELLRYMGINKLETRAILRKEKRTIGISDPLKLGENPLPIEVRVFHIKQKYPGLYYRIFLKAVEEGM